MKLSMREYMAPGDTLLEKCQNLKELGFDGIELVTTGHPDEVDEIRAVIEETGIRPTCVSARAGCLVDARREERQAAVQSHLDALEVAAEIGAIGVISAPLIKMKMQIEGPRPRIPDLWPLGSLLEMEKRMVLELYRRIAERGAELGTCIIVEPLNRYEQDWPRTLRDGIEICQAIDSPGMMMMADFFHMNIEESDIAAALEEALPYLRNVHIADSNRQTVPHGHTDLLPGRRVLKQGGYDGYFGLESAVPGPCSPKTGPDRMIGFPEEKRGRTL